MILVDTPIASQRYHRIDKRASISILAFWVCMSEVIISLKFLCTVETTIHAMSFTGDMKTLMKCLYEYVVKGG